MKRKQLLTVLRRRHPDVDAEAAIAAGLVRVNGSVASNPRSLVEPDAAIALRPMRGSHKLAFALRTFAVSVQGRIALDVGAAAGGFTRALLDAGAARVYAVDAGRGQLAGPLRRDARVVNLESTNVAALSASVIPDAIDVVTVDVSYLALGAAVEQLASVRLAPDADLIGLVKPMFELRLGSAPSEAASVDAAIARASRAIAAAGWTVVAATHSPLRGSRGAAEALVHARRNG